MELTASDLWSRILESARSGVPDQSFKTWLSMTNAVALSEGELVVEAPSEFHVQWIEDKFALMLEDAARRVLGRPLHLCFKTGLTASQSMPSSFRVETSALLEAPALNAPAVYTASSAAPAPSASLNELYTFARFVVGDNSQLAAAACHAVADRPARMYNPLFLYGGVGLGKTHLMHAIGHRMREVNPSRYVIYVTCEEFTNELVTAIKEGTTAEFRRRYRRADLLLVDDVHFLEGKERTQEEFFHTFNTLYDAQRQIVLTSDRPPKAIKGLEERLMSRFEWGLVADIKPPDYETRYAILRKKAEDERLLLEDEVLSFIAYSCTASVRQLEGAIIKLLAYSSLKNQEITVSLARTALSGILLMDSPPPRLTPDHIRDLVARRWNVRPDALTSKRRTKDLTVPRQVAMYLIKQVLDTPLVQIGDAFGGRDHSTVIHSIRKVETDLQADAGFRAQVEAVETELRRTSPGAFNK
jgi:chromosomal replication initiator protein